MNVKLATTEEAPASHWAETKAPEHMSLVELLQLLRAIDEGTVEASKERWAAVANALPGKVDEHVLRVEELRGRAKAIRELVKAHLDKAMALEVEAAKLDEEAFAEAQQGSIAKLPGKVFRLAVKESYRCTPTRATPSEEDLLNHGTYVRIKFEWDKTALTKALKAEDATVRAIAKFEAHKSYGWEANTP